MKKALVLFAAFTAVGVLRAQDNEQKIDKEKTIDYSFAWGLFKSENYLKGKQATFHFEKPQVTTGTISKVDTIKYESKSLLWGAVQWTEKRKDASQSRAKKQDKSTGKE